MTATTSLTHGPPPPSKRSTRSNSPTPGSSPWRRFAGRASRVETPVLFAMDGSACSSGPPTTPGSSSGSGTTRPLRWRHRDQRGRRLGPVIQGRARILGPDAVEPTLRLLHAKHRIAGPLFTALRHLRGKGDVIIEIRLAPAA